MIKLKHSSEYYPHIDYLSEISMNFSDDTKFFTLTYMEESSQFDPNAVWNAGGEYYEVEVACRIPHEICEDEDAIDEFIDNHQHLDGFWVEKNKPQNRYHTSEQAQVAQEHIQLLNQKDTQLKEVYDSMNSMSRMLSQHKP
jgi:hypothetical protein